MMVIRSLVGKVSVYRTGSSGSIPGRTNTQDFKTSEEKVLSSRIRTLNRSPSETSVFLCVSAM